MKTIAEGEQVPDFELPDQNGHPVRLSTVLQDGPVVLFFYPVALSGGCTTEACHFRDLATEFKEAGAQRYGISTDSVAKQKEFVRPMHTQALERKATCVDCHKGVAHAAPE